jgi:DNA-binding HxlR family transcriptional regulator
VRVRYSLTDLGASLRPVIEAMAEWGNEHLTDPTEGDA